MKSDLEYQLQACRNLEAEMTARGWPADAAHYRRRALAVAEKLSRSALPTPHSALK